VTLAHQLASGFPPLFHVGVRQGIDLLAECAKIPARVRDHDLISEAMFGHPLDLRMRHQGAAPQGAGDSI
jgi:hypothetical protein